MRGENGVLEAAGLPYFTSIIADSDLDGLCAAAVLKAANPDAVVHFGHAALVRSGALDHLIDRNTAMVDLPFHPACGWYLDHHQTNRPNEAEEAEFTANGGTCHWEATPSAARLAYDVLNPFIDLHHLEEIMPVVDALDSGQISRDEFIKDGPILQLSRSLSMREPEHMQRLLSMLAAGTRLADVLANEEIAPHVERAKQERQAAQRVVEAHTTIVDRLAICRMDEKGVRSNGYLVTAWAGTEPMLVASSTAMPMVQSKRPNARRFQPVSTRTHFFQTAKDASISRGLQPLLIQLEAATQMPVVVEYSHRVLIQILKSGWICGKTALKFWLFNDQPITVNRYRNPKNAWINTSTTIKSAALPCFNA